MGKRIRYSMSGNMLRTISMTTIDSRVIAARINTETRLTEIFINGNLSETFVGKSILHCKQLIKESFIRNGVAELETTRKPYKKRGESNGEAEQALVDSIVAGSAATIP